MQEELLLRVNYKEDILISGEFLRRIPSWKDAIRTAKNFSGLSDKQYCSRLRIDPAQWSRIWSAQAHFPEEKLEEFIRLNGNLIPIHWLAFRFGYGLYQLKNDVEIELEKVQAEKEELQKRLSYFEELIKKVRL